MKLQVLLFFYLLQIYIAYPHFRTCKNINLLSISIFLLHNVTDVYIFYGLFINESLIEYVFHMCMIIIVMLHWYYNNYQCEITKKLNEICERNPNEWEYNIIGIIAEYTDIYYLHTYLLFGLLIYDGYKIINFTNPSLIDQVYQFILN
jgi:hypothetical protein